MVSGRPLWAGPLTMLLGRWKASIAHQEISLRYNRDVLGSSIDYVIRLEQKRWRKRETEAFAVLRLRTITNLVGWLDWEIGGSRAPQDLVDIDGAAPVEIGVIRGVAHQAANLHGPVLPEHRRQSVPNGQLGQLLSLREDECGREHKNRLCVLSSHRQEGAL